MKNSQNWFIKLIKTAFKIENLEDRRIIIDRIKYMNQCISDLNRAKELIQQNAPGVQNKIKDMLDDKRLSSYPTIINSLKYANSIARDSYQKFKKEADVAIVQLEKIIYDLENERKKFNNETLPNKLKEYTEKKR